MYYTEYTDDYEQLVVDPLDKYYTEYTDNYKLTVVLSYILITRSLRVR